MYFGWERGFSFIFSLHEVKISWNLDTILLFGGRYGYLLCQGRPWVLAPAQSGCTCCGTEECCWPQGGGVPLNIWRSKWGINEYIILISDHHSIKSFFLWDFLSLILIIHYVMAISSNYEICSLFQFNFFLRGRGEQKQQNCLINVLLLILCSSSTVLVILFHFKHFKMLAIDLKLQQCLKRSDKCHTLHFSSWFLLWFSIYISIRHLQKILQSL